MTGKRSRPLIVEAVDRRGDDAEVLAAIKPHVTKGEPMVVVCVSVWKDPPIAKEFKAGARVQLWTHPEMGFIEGSPADFVQLALEAYKDLHRSAGEAPPKGRQS